MIENDTIDLWGPWGRYDICARCEHFESDGKGIDTEYGPVPVGECHRFPPVGKTDEDGMNTHPRVVGWNHCGEFKWNSSVSVCRGLENSRAEQQDSAESE
jgi:hypothetical protein